MDNYISLNEGTLSTEMKLPNLYVISHVISLSRTIGLGIFTLVQEISIETSEYPY